MKIKQLKLVEPGILPGSSLLKQKFWHFQIHVQSGIGLKYFYAIKVMISKIICLKSSIIIPGCY